MLLSEQIFKRVMQDNIHSKKLKLMKGRGSPTYEVWDIRLLSVLC